MWIWYGIIWPFMADFVNSGWKLSYHDPPPYFGLDRGTWAGWSRGIGWGGNGSAASAELLKGLVESPPYMLEVFVWSWSLVWWFAEDAAKVLCRWSVKMTT